MKQLLENGGCVFLGCVVVIVIFIVTIIANICFILNTEYVEGTLTQVFVDNGNLRFVLARDDGVIEVFTNNDAYLRGKWNSNDLVPLLEEGKHYRLKVNFIRIRFLSYHRNILEIVEINQ